ncbi:MAG: DMT family transporter [Verrucomicrobiota bacterium]
MSGSQSQHIQGSLCALGGGICMALLGIVAKLGAPQQISAFQLVAAQMSLISLIMAVVILWRSGWRGFAIRNGKVFATRITAGMIYFSAIFLSLQGIPLTDALVLESTNPFWALLITAVMGKKRMTLPIALLLMVAFTGVCLILIVHSLDAKQMLNGFALLALLSGIARAVGGLSTKALTKVEPVERILFFYPLCVCLMASLTFPWTWGSASIAVIWPYLLATAVIFVPLGLFWSFANKWIPSYLAGALFYSAIVVSAVADYFIWQVQFRPQAILGMGLVISAGLGLILLEAQAAKQRDERVS